MLERILKAKCCYDCCLIYNGDFVFYYYSKLKFDSKILVVGVENMILIVGLF